MLHPTPQASPRADSVCGEISVKRLHNITKLIKPALSAALMPAEQQLGTWILFKLVRKRGGWNIMFLVRMLRPPVARMHAHILQVIQI